MWASSYRETNYLVVHAVCRQGKTLGVGQRQHAASYRHKNPLHCPVSHLGWMWFWRFHHENEPYFDFSSRARWYKRKILSQKKDKNEALANRTYDKTISLCHEIANVPHPLRIICAKRHLGRKLGAQLLQARKVARDSIGSFGGWQDGKLYNWTYLFQLDDECMHAAAGCRKDEILLLPRADVADTSKVEFFASFIFPAAVPWKERLEATPQEFPDIWLRKGADDSRVAALGCNDLLVHAFPPPALVPCRPVPTLVVMPPHVSDLPPCVNVGAAALSALCRCRPLCCRPLRRRPLPNATHHSPCRPVLDM